VPVKVPLFLFLAVSCFSFINTEFLYLSARALVSKNIKFVLLYFVVVKTLDSREKLFDFMKIAAISFYIIVLNGFIQYFISHVDLLHNYPSFKHMPFYHEEPFIGFPTSSFPYPNDLAAWLLMFLLPGLSALLFGIRTLKYRVAEGILLCAGFYLLVLTKARGAYLGFLAALAPLTLLNIRKIFVLALVLIVALSALVLINKALPTGTRGYSSTLDDVLSFASVSDRMVMWRNGWKIFMRHPVIGNGINTFFKHYAEVREDQYKYKKGSYAHNCYLQMAADTGIVGLVSFMLAMGVFFVSSAFMINGMSDMFLRAVATGLLAALFGFLVHSFFDTNLYSLNLAALFWSALGVESALLKVEKETRQR